MRRGVPAGAHILVKCFVRLVTRSYLVNTRRGKPRFVGNQRTGRDSELLLPVKDLELADRGAVLCHALDEQPHQLGSDRGKGVGDSLVGDRRSFGRDFPARSLCVPVLNRIGGGAVKRWERVLIDLDRIKGLGLSKVDLEVFPAPCHRACIPTGGEIAIRRFGRFVTRVNAVGG